MRLPVKVLCTLALPLVVMEGNSSANTAAAGQ